MVGSVITAAGAMAEYAAWHCEGMLAGVLRATGVLAHLGSVFHTRTFQAWIDHVTGSSLPDTSPAADGEIEFFPLDDAPGEVQ